MEEKYEIFQGCIEFEWDRGNIEKNWEKHRVAPTECEQVFLNQPLVVTDDEKHSGHEKRYYALGQTDEQRLLFIVFTIRGEKVRVISARNMNKNERKVYRES